MSEPIMSPAAYVARRQYYNVERWENKAKRIYGDNYEPPAPTESISRQALELRRADGREKHKRYATAYKRGQCNYWERKAKKGATKT